MIDWTSVAIWLLVSVATLAVSAYEIAGLTVDGWHTISYFAHRNILVRIAILSLFLAGGIGGATWWLHHAAGNIAK